MDMIDEQIARGGSAPPEADRSATKDDLIEILKAVGYTLNKFEERNDQRLADLGQRLGLIEQDRERQFQAEAGRRLQLPELWPGPGEQETENPLSKLRRKFQE